MADKSSTKTHVSAELGVHASGGKRVRTASGRQVVMARLSDAFIHPSKLGLLPADELAKELKLPSEG